MRRTVKCLVLLVAIGCLSGILKAQEILNNPGFEGDYTTRATNWGNISWGTGTSVSYEGITTNVHAGDKCQKMTVNQFGSSGGVLLYQNVAVDAGNVFEASIWLRADSETDVEVALRTNSSLHHYRTCGIHRVTLDTNWQEIRFQAVPAYDNAQANHQFVIAPKEAGVGIYIDDASLTNITDTKLTHIQDGLTQQLPIPESYFGLHVNKGHEGVWPTTGQKLIRLWDTGTRWSDIEPTDDIYNWSRFDLYINSLIQGNDADCKILYCMGITPTWANSVSNSTLPPDDMTDWDDYVRQVVQRYKGKIQYYEIWNETNVSTFYTGNIEDLVELAQRAYDIIRQEDPAAMILTPNFAFFGLATMAKYFHAGGGVYADAISCHVYHPMENAGTRDRMLTMLAMRSVADQYGYAHLPLFNTETALTYGQTSYPTDTQIRAGVAHGMILNRLLGSETYPHYFWEPSAALRVALAVYIDDPELTVGGETYRELANWLKGKRITSFENINSRAVQPVTVDLDRGPGYKVVLVWAWAGNPTYVPDSSLHVNNIRYLDGTFQTYAGGVITLDQEPILLECNPKYCDNLIGYWTGDNNAMDVTTFDHDGTLNGTVTYDSGLHDTAYVFSGTSGESISVASTDHLESESLSISLWYNIASNATWDRYLLGKSSFGNKTGYQLFLNSSNQPVFRLYDGSNWGWVDAQINSPSAPVLDQWHHVVATYDGTTMLMYVDGELQSHKALTGYTINYNGDNLKIGGSYNGMIDDVRLYNYALAANEVDGLNGLVGHWTLDSTTITNSLSEPQISGTLNGNVTLENGIIGNSLKFDASQSTYLTINSQPELTTDQFTCAVWINCQEVWDNSSTTSYKYLMSKSTWNDRAGFLLMGKNNGTLVFRTYDGTSYGWQSREIVIPFLNYVDWVHVAAVNDATQLRLYINGTLVAEKTVADDYLDHAGGDLKIGQSFTGMMDDVRFYNRPLTDRQIQTLYFNESPVD